MRSDCNGIVLHWVPKLLALTCALSSGHTPRRLFFFLTYDHLFAFCVHLVRFLHSTQKLTDTDQTKQYHQKPWWQCWAVQPTAPQWRRVQTNGEELVINDKHMHREREKRQVLQGSWMQQWRVPCNTGSLWYMYCVDKWFPFSGLGTDTMFKIYIKKRGNILFHC